MKSRPPLVHGFDVRLSEERITRSWEAVARTLPRRRVASRTFRRAAPFVALAVAVLVAVVAIRTRPDDPFDGAVIETGPAEQQSLQLADGSRLVLAPSTRLRLVHLGWHNVRLQLERGAIDAHVTHVPGRSFSVTTADVQVGVVGTRFRVELDEDDEQVHVSVAEGRVRLSAIDGAWPDSYVAAGQTWSSPVAPSLQDPPDDDDLDAAAADEHPRLRVQAPRPPAVRHSPLPPGFSSLYRQGRYTEAYDLLGPDGFADAAHGASPEELMMLAETARLSRHTTDAAMAFDVLESRYPHDSRAALAAMELGRLRLNELDDPDGAKTAFEDAIQLDPNGPLREDAEARRVEAIERTGDRGACRAARDEYLATYPQGVHAASVARMCR